VQGGDELTKLLQDAYRFIIYHKGPIESYPLQSYASALLFSPSRSVIRQLFQHEEPKGIGIWPAMSDRWSACLQTLEGYSDWLMSVAFSHDSARLASSSKDKTVKIWMRAVVRACRPSTLAGFFTTYPLALPALVSILTQVPSSFKPQKLPA
jgi:WD40 repeat protein